MKKIYTIGRDEGCDIVIQDNTDVISRLHATLRIESNNKIYLIDQSLNGTYINGMKMSSNVEIPVSREDVISFAHIYNLDWSLIPKHQNNTLKILLIIIVGIILITGITYSIMSYFGTTDEIAPADEVKTETELTQPEVQEKVSVPDTIVVRDTVVIAKDAPRKEEVKEEKPKTEKETPEEEVYNPIY